MQDGWILSNKITEDYYHDNKVKLIKSASLMKDLTDANFTDIATVRDLLYDFGAKYKRNLTKDADAYLQDLDDRGLEKLFFDAGLQREKFDNFQEFIDEF